MKGSKKLALLKKYIQRGWPIFPLHWLKGEHCSCGKRDCASPGKHPRLKGGFQGASTDSAKVAAWHQRWPRANWGMRTGSLEGGGSGILVVDIDPKHQGFEAWEMLVMNHPDREDTVTVNSGGGGIHLWYQLPEGTSIASSAGILAPGVDIRADGGYIIIPPSKTKAPYRFELLPSETPLQMLPDWLRSELERSIRHGTSPLPAAGKRVPPGQRHRFLLSTAVQMQAAGMDYDSILPALKALRDARFDPGDHAVSDAEVESVARWVCNLPTDDKETDLGNAERYVRQHYERVRYCYELKMWLCWNGVIWVRDEERTATKRAHQTVRSIYAEAAKLTDPKAQKARLNHARRSEASGRIDAMLRIARVYLNVRSDQLDQHPDLLTLRDGILNLRTGELQAHDPDLMLTRMVDIPYDPQASCPEWIKFLEMVTGRDQAYMRYLQTAAGYSLTGRIDEHIYFFIYGKGSNGKTTFMETLKMVMGDFFVKVPMDSLLEAYHGRGGPTPYIARLFGARLAQTSEVPEDGKLDEALVKELTGGDTLTARHMYKEPFEFYPSHKLWGLGNYKPKVVGIDDGFWRRFRVLPFSKSIPTDTILSMHEVLAKFKAEREGILAWMAAGAVRWYAEKLPTPTMVAEATAQYRTDIDVVGLFIEDSCQIGADYRVPKSNLYQAWRSWCLENGEHDYANKSKAWLTRRLTRMSFKMGGSGNAFMLGLKLKRSE